MLQFTPKVPLGHSGYEKFIITRDYLLLNVTTIKKNKSNIFRLFVFFCPTKHMEPSPLTEAANFDLYIMVISDNT